MFALHRRIETDAAFFRAIANHFLKPRKGTAHNKQNIAGIDLKELLLRMLTTALRRHRCSGAFDQLKQRLLNTFARYVAGDRGVFRLTGNLIDLINVNNATLSFFYVVVALLQQLLNDVLNIFAHIARFSQRCSVSNGKRHVEQARQRFSEQRFTAAGGANQQNIAFAKLNVIVVTARPRAQALVVVVHRYRQHGFRPILADDILIERGPDFLRRRKAIINISLFTLEQLFTNNVVT